MSMTSQPSPLEILALEFKIDDEVADFLSKKFGNSREFWLNLEKNYVAR